MTIVIWADRVCFVRDGYFIMSAKGQPDNFDFWPTAYADSDTIAIKGYPGMTPSVDDMYVKDDKLILHCAEGTFAVEENNPLRITRVT